MRNTNALLGTVAGVNGLKTGWTVASGYNLIVTAQRGKTRLLAVVLGGSSRNARDGRGPPPGWRPASCARSPKP